MTAGELRRSHALRDAEEGTPIVLLGSDGQFQELGLVSAGNLFNACRANETTEMPIAFRVEEKEEKDAEPEA